MFWGDVHTHFIHVLGGWVGKVYLSWRFVWQSGSKEDMGSSKEKIL